MRMIPRKEESKPEIELNGGVLAGPGTISKIAYSACHSFPLVKEKIWMIDGEKFSEIGFVFACGSKMGGGTCGKPGQFSSKDALAYRIADLWARSRFAYVWPLGFCANKMGMGFYCVKSGDRLVKMGRLASGGEASAIDAIIGGEWDAMEI